MNDVAELLAKPGLAAAPTAIWRARVHRTAIGVTVWPAPVDVRIELIDVPLTARGQQSQDMASQIGCKAEALQLHEVVVERVRPAEMQDLVNARAAKDRTGVREDGPAAGIDRVP